MWVEMVAFSILELLPSSLDLLQACKEIDPRDLVRDKKDKREEVEKEYECERGNESGRGNIAQPIQTILDGSNYTLWVQDIRNFLKGRKLRRYVIGDITEPVCETNEVDGAYKLRIEEWDNNNHKVISWFDNTSIKSIRQQFGKFDTAKEVVNFLLHWWIKNLESQGSVPLPFLEEPEYIQYGVSREVEYAKEGSRKSVQVRFLGLKSSFWNQMGSFLRSSISNPRILSR
ncbi:Pheophytinase, chloroplastic [Ananas comosus]|uniref:Pheophytinase, chloroplastic n=1 Tax=Ananas comosus TaxID=4615 RepID=A0A199W6P5_ANACO|nr:Pheophytinase, chloroplastic [Ananas comosus]